MTKLYTDTSANLPLALLREYDIAVIPFSYTVNGVAEDYNEETDFDGKAFYDAMRRGAEVKTSMVNPATAAAFFERALAQGDDVLYVGMSGGISGTAHAAALAAEELREKYPRAKIMTIDTYAASLGEGLQVLEAAELLRAGRSFEEVGDRILARRPHMCQFFTVDDLNYLKRGGRISGAAALVGSVLGIKPILRGDETGHIVSCGKVRGMKRAYQELANYYDGRALDKSEMLGIAHADNEEGAQALIALLRDKGFTGECLNVVYEPVTGAHVGPGTVALFFYGGNAMWVNVLSMVLFGIAIGVLICFLGGLMAVDIVPRKATGAALGVVGMTSYIAAGIQDVASGWLIDSNITVAADGVKHYDFGPVAIFWLAAAVISFLLPLLNRGKVKEF